MQAMQISADAALSIILFWLLALYVKPAILSGKGTEIFLVALLISTHLLDGLNTKPTVPRSTLRCK